METVIILSVAGILLVGCWHVGNVSQKHWEQLETDPESVVLIERKWDGAIWGPFLIGSVVIAWVVPILLGYVVAGALFCWAVVWTWLNYVDWDIAITARGSREQRTDDRSRFVAKGPARLRHSLPRIGRASGGISTPGRVI
jgi:hypothetical protein